ncbi:MAG: hypothetical protein GWP08_19385 [Nitrospiraceae bacterium]|nr:hypothetical protein [Nitrospiraceae bacterium]
MSSERTYLIGIDAGTTGLKSLVFDLEGHSVAAAYREYPLDHPQPDAAEQNPDLWWQALGETVREVLQCGGVPPASVAGLSVSSQGSTVVLLGPDNRPVRPAISWLDRRSVDLSEPGELSEEDLFTISGLRRYPGWTEAMIRWLRAKEPAALRATSKLLLVGDYLIYRLTGSAMTDHSSASRTRMFDIHRREWSEPVLASLDLPREKLPSIGCSGQIAGHVSHESAQITGLLAGTPVTLGGFDQSCAMLGAGAIAEDTLTVSLGTATAVSVTTSRALIDFQHRISTTSHVLPDRWAVQAPIMTTGAILRWCRDQFAPGEGGGFYRDMDDRAARVPLGANGLLWLPYFGGAGAPRWDANLTGGVFGLSLSHTGAHIYRAILEGIAFEIRANAGVLSELGIKTSTVRIVGGGARSVLWRRIIGDVLGKPQACVPEVETGTLGAAILASLGAHVYKDVWEATARMTASPEFEPFDQTHHRAYAACYERYNRLADALSDAMVRPAPGVMVAPPDDMLGFEERLAAIPK